MEKGRGGGEEGIITINMLLDIVCRTFSSVSLAISSSNDMA